MKIKVDRAGNDIHVVLEREPMSPERFEAVCKLVGAAIGGGVLLGAVQLVGAWAIGGALLVLILVGLFIVSKDF